jgi:putative Mg2+ transporter-C (MgtC) family protein
MFFGEQVGQGWLQISELSLAFVLSALIGLEREIHQKSAGLRTHTLVGVASALIMLISKYGFTDVLVDGRVVVDPSRIAAQVVSGIGFIGGGLIFVHRDSVRGLTTAAIVWITAAIGLACGAGLPILALAATVWHFIVVFTFPHIVRRIPNSVWTTSILKMSFEDGKEVLKAVLTTCAQYKFTVSCMSFERPFPVAGQFDRKYFRIIKCAEVDELNPQADGSSRDEMVEKIGQTQIKKIVQVVLEVQGGQSVLLLAAKVADIDGIVSVSVDDGNVQPSWGADNIGDGRNV